MRGSRAAVFINLLTDHPRLFGNQFSQNRENRKCQAFQPSPSYLRGLPSPYYTEGHRRFQKAAREFLYENLIKHAMEWEKEGTVPEHVFKDFCKANMLLPNLPAPLPAEWLKRLGIHDILGVKVEEWDYLHTGIYTDEVC